MNKQQTIKNHPSYYAIIPASVRYNNCLCPNAKLMYGEITALSNKHGYCYASNSYFSELYQKSEVSVSKWIQQLEEQGYIFSFIYHKKGNKCSKKRALFIIEDITNIEGLKEKFMSFSQGDKEKFKTLVEGLKEKFKCNSIINVINNKVLSLDNTSILSKDKITDSLNKESLVKKDLKKEKSINKKHLYKGKIIENALNLYKDALKTGLFKKHKIPLLNKENLRIGTYIKFQKNMQDLLSGQFLKKEFDFKTKYNFNRIKNIKTWDRLKNLLDTALDRFMIMHEENYWPTNKETLTNDLSTFFYNPYTKKSWFLRCISNAPKCLSDEAYEKVRESIKNKEALEIADELYQNTFDKLAYWKKIKEIEKWHNKNVDDLDMYHTYKYESSYGSYLGYFESVMEYYKKFFSTWDSLTVNHFGVNCKTWRRFVEYIKKELGFDLMPDKGEVEAAIKWHEENADLYEEEFDENDKNNVNVYTEFAKMFNSDDLEPLPI